MKPHNAKKLVTLAPRVFRTAYGVLVTVETAEGGARVYAPILAAWSRVFRDRSQPPIGRGLLAGRPAVGSSPRLIFTNPSFLDCPRSFVSDFKTRPRS